MFWWRKRNEGFEWRDYVRTTILVRREQRRQKLKDVQAAAASHVKEAGKRGLDAGVAGARVAGVSAWSHAKAGARGLGTFALAAGRTGVGAAAAAALWLSQALAAAANRIGAPLGPVLEPVLTVVRRPRVDLALKAAAVLAGLGAAYRTWTFGFDTDARVAAVVSGLSAVLLLVAYLTDPDRAQEPRRRNALLDRLNTTEFELPGNRTLSAPAAGLAGLVLLAVVLAGGGALYYGAPALVAGLSSSSPTPIRTGALAEPDAGRLEGRALALSGDRLRISGTRVVLDGIEAPEAGQTCQRKSGRWRCGQAAKEALAALTRGRRVSCDIVSDDGTEKRARCEARGADLAGALVQNGHVFANGGFLSRYASLESEAKDAKAGLWAGEAERPQDYRDKRWEEARKAAPEGCPIKGRVRSGTRTYILPWSSGYDSVRLSKTRGERWFCSENEAQAAGWQPDAAS